MSVETVNNFHRNNQVIGESGITGVIPGIISVQTGAVATGANTTETTLYTYTLPAKGLNYDGKYVRIRTWGTVAANGNNKTIKLYFGATSFTTTALAANAKDWALDAIFVRTGAATGSLMLIGGIANAAVLASPLYVASTDDLTAAAIIKVTGTNGTATASDIVGYGMAIELC